MQLIVDEIRERHRQREDLLRARGRLTNQLSAISRRLCRGHHCRGEKCSFRLCKPDMAEATSLYKALLSGRDHLLRELAAPWTDPLIAAIAPLQQSIKDVERILPKLVRQLPAWRWALGVRGLGEIGVAQIVGEAGDLFNYPGPRPLWKRFGLNVWDDGTRARLVKGQHTGFCPERRAIMHNIGTGLIVYSTHYRGLYDVFRARREARALAEGLEIVSGKEKPGQISRGHLDKHAKRLMEKELLKDIWRAWKVGIDR